jgi:hypothetical protein
MKQFRVLIAPKAAQDIRAAFDYLEQFPFRLNRFAGVILLSCKERIAVRSGATV